MYDELDKRGAENNQNMKITSQCFVLTEFLGLVCVLVLQQIKPEAYRNIFLNSLEPDILNQILRTLHGFYIK